MPKVKGPSEPDEYGFRTMLSDIHPSTWNLALILSAQLKVPPRAALRVIHQAIGVKLEREGAAFLGGIFESAFTYIEQNPDKFSSRGLPPIDFDALHTSVKTKSGYVGVYTNGKGFRAMAKLSKTNPKVVSIGTFPTAEQAAWARHLHYKKEGLPYGVLEEEIEAALRDHPEFANEPQEVLLDLVNTRRKDAGLDPLHLPDEGDEPDEPEEQSSQNRQS